MESILWTFLYAGTSKKYGNVHETKEEKIYGDGDENDRIFFRFLHFSDYYEVAHINVFMYYFFLHHTTLILMFLESFFC